MSYKMKSLLERHMRTSKGLVFDIKRFAVHDGDGIRTTIFLKGCPLRCRWCQNPEGLLAKPQVLYMENKCMHCFSCVHLCKNDGVTCVDGQILIDRTKKEDWEKVVDICPTLALCLDSSYYSVDELIEEIIKDQAFFIHGGGVTFSGGEPLLQVDFLLDILKRCKELGLHTAIETSLYCDINDLKRVLPYLDQIYCDCKIFDEALHIKYTGVSNRIILDNICYLLQSNKKANVIVRTPLIPEMSATLENIGLISKFLSSLYSDVRYEILNYNPLAKAKYAYLDMDYCFDENPGLYSKSELEVFYQCARQNGIKKLVSDH